MQLHSNGCRITGDNGNIDENYWLDNHYKSFIAYTSEDVEFFEGRCAKRAIWGGRPTKAFVKFTALKKTFEGNYNPSIFKAMLVHKYGPPKKE